MPLDDRPALALPSPPPLAPPEGFAARLAGLDVRVDDAAIAAIGDYLARLLAMNEQMNLTAIEEPTAAWERHALDALTALPLLPAADRELRLIDIGSGGGLPGIPLAIARPDLRVTLVEATQKKAAFLWAVVKALGLPNVTVFAERSEKLAEGPLAGAFDVVTARAVARLSLLVPLAAPFAKPGGLLLLFKGQRAEEELREAARALASRRVTHVKTAATPTGKIIVLKRAARP